MTVERACAHGGAEFQSALEGNDFHVEAVGGEHAVFLRGVQNERVRGGQRAYFQGVGCLGGMDAEQGERQGEGGFFQYGHGRSLEC